jgi:hypothetical protein
MTKLLPQFWILLTALFCCNVAFAQVIDRSVISSGGGTSTNTAGNIMLAYNIGEPVAEFLDNSNGKTCIGFIQFDSDFNLDITAGTTDISSKLVLFPNPVVSGVTKLDFQDIPNGSYNVDIVDAIGHVLYTQTIAYAKNNNIKLDLNVAGFKGGTYYVRVRNGSTQGKLKLVKL